jgi:elongation factor Ts
MVKDLRDKAGAGFVDCKKALEQAGGDAERAAGLLRDWGAAAAGKKAGRSAQEGLVESYVHAGGRLGVLVEVNCETDFVARTAEFRSFVHDVAMQIAAERPAFVSKEDVPGEVLARKQAELEEQARAEGKPEALVERIVAGRLAKFVGEVCLMEQPYIRDQDKNPRKIGDLVREMIAKFGENVRIRRFACLELGEQVDE